VSDLRDSPDLPDPPDLLDLLDLRSLSAGYDGVAVVHDVDLRVGPGEVVGLLGGNGAGKTTTLLAISGLIPALAGAVRLFGAPPGRVTRRVEAGLAHVPEDRGLSFDLTVREHIRLAAPRRRTRPALDGTVDLFPALGPLLDRPAGLLSGGEQQMLALARALARRPRLLLVDEMSLGLAPIVVERLMASLRAVVAESGVGALVVEQHVPLLLSVIDRGYVLTRGRVTLAGTKDELAAQAGAIEAEYLGRKP
jgi:branched-chain amino acid transport system ATP-binding protein